MEVSFVAPVRARMVTAAEGWLEFLGVVCLLRGTEVQAWVELEASFVAPLSAQMVIAAELWLEAKGQFLGVVLLQGVTAVQVVVDVEANFVPLLQAIARMKYKETYL